MGKKNTINDIRWKQTREIRRTSEETMILYWELDIAKVTKARFIRRIRLKGQFQGIPNKKTTKKLHTGRRTRIKMVRNKFLPHKSH